MHSALKSLAVIGHLSLIACAGLPSPDARTTPGMPRSIVDLSPTLDEEFALRYLGYKVVEMFGLRERTEFDHMITEEPFYAATSYVTLYTHGGPHHDPPSHIIRGAASSDEIGLEQFFGAARVLDFRDRPRDAPLLRKDFADKGILPGEIVIAVVGYRPPDDPREFPSFPSLSGEAAEGLATLPVKAFATDMCCLMDPEALQQRMASGLEGSEKQK